MDMYSTQASVVLKTLKPNSCNQCVYLATTTIYLATKNY